VAKYCPIRKFQMNKYFILPILFSTIILGCGSSDSGCTTHECVDKLNGVAGGGADSGGASDVAGSSSDAGSTTGGKSTSSKNTVTGSSVGGSSIGGSTVSPVGGASTIETTTIGGTSSLGGASFIGGSVSFGGSNVATGGTSAATTTKVCIPRTCADIAIAIGNSNLSKPITCNNLTIEGTNQKYTSDNCGGKLDCGSCPLDGITKNIGCGEFPEDDPSAKQLYIWSAKGLEKTPNICGSRCYKDPQGSSTHICKDGQTDFVCPSTEIRPENEGNCKLTGVHWCCDPT
jgi:hypothetical protein